VEFQAEDGTNLVGYYYPAAVDPAPALVLMHWAGGMHCDWVFVNLVQWAQNRGLPEGLAANPACANAEIHIRPPLAEFPPLPAGQSYAVFAFDYRGYGESAGSTYWNPAGYLQDSIAAMKTAQGLEGVDPARVAAIGSSIGADGAIDACAEGCLGALSLSPGNYLGKSYSDEVTRLGAEQKPAWCVAFTGDGESYPVCNGASGDFFQKFIYEKNGHGTSFFEEGFDPKVTQIIFDFMQLVFGK
jgi:predicted alpha/beta hydrolase